MWRRRLSSLAATSICHSYLSSSKPPATIPSSLITHPPFLPATIQWLLWKPDGVRVCISSISRGMMTGLSSVALLLLNDLRDNKGARQKKKRKGRGIGSGKGKTVGRGHKGQKARGTFKFGFEGGQTPLRRRLPKRGFKNPFSLTFQPVGLGKIAKLINAGKIDSSELINMKILKDTSAIGKQIKDGIRLMGRGTEHIKWRIHLEVSRVTVRAKEAVEAAGGSVRKVYYNKLGFCALLKPEWFEKKGRLLPKRARPLPKQRYKVDSIGRLPAPTKPIPFLPEEEDSPDVYPQARKLFFSKVHQYIKERLLYAKYACGFLFNITGSHPLEFKEDKHNLMEFVQMCHRRKAHQLSMQRDVNSSSTYLENILTYLVHSLAHHPSCPNVDECKEFQAFESIY